MHIYTIAGIEIPFWVLIPAFCFIWFIVGWVVKKIILASLLQLTKKTESDIDDIIIESASNPILILLVASGGAIAYQFLTPEVYRKLLVPWVPLGLKSLTIFSVILYVDQVLSRLLTSYSAKVEFLKISQGLMRGILHALVFGIGILIILDSIGISITPIIASLGIGSLAIALALQPTLENLFSGFQIIMDQPVKPGHFIKLESGEEGIVEKISWRSTWVRQLPNNTIIIPNKVLVNSRVLNYHYPTKDLSFTIDVGVHYNSDLNFVEKITIEVAEKVLKDISGGVSEFKPVVRFNSLGASSINFAVVLRAADYTDIGLLRHEFIKALTYRYAKEGINIPYPTTAINFSQEKVSLSGN